MESKEQLLSQAENLFMRYGIKSVTMDDIASKLGISKKTLYQNVSNKADLIRQVFHQHIQMEIRAMDAIVKEADNAIDEILNIAKFVLDLVRVISPKTLYDLHKYYRKSWNMIEEMHKKYVYQVIKQNLDRGIAEKLYREDIDSDIVAKLYTGKSLLTVDEDLFPMQEYTMEQLYKEFIVYHIHGVASKKGLKLLDQYNAKK